MDKKTAIIIGAGPAGLTAAYKLLKGEDFCPIPFALTPVSGVTDSAILSFLSATISRA